MEFSKAVRTAIMGICALVLPNVYISSPCIAQLANKSFADLYDDYLFDQTQLPEAQSHNYFISHHTRHETSLFGKPQVRTFFVEEVGQVATDPDKAGGLMCSATRTTSIFESDDEEKIEDYMLYLRWFKKGDINKICESSVQGVGAIRDIESEHSVPGFSTVDLELLPYCNYHSFTQGGGFRQELVSNWKDSKVISDGTNADGNREIWIVFSRKISAAKVIFVEPLHWRAKEVRFFRSKPVNGKQALLSDNEASPVDFVKANWVESCQLSLDWIKRTTDGKAFYIPSIAKMSSFDHAQKMNMEIAVFTNGWKFGDDVKSLRIENSDFEKLCKESIDFEWLKKSILDGK